MTNEAVVRRFYDELWNRWQFELADEILAAGDRVVTRMTWSGTHLGALGEVAATGVEVKYAGAAFRLAGGLIEEAWVVGDTQELWRALGVLPAGAGE